MNKPISSTSPQAGDPVEPAHIFALLESHDQTKINEAIALLADHPEVNSLAEQRYLPWIQYRLSDQDAGLDRIEEAALTQEEEAVFDSRYYLGKDFISFGMANGKEVRLIVDLIGAITKGAFDAETYLSETGKAKDRKALVAIVDQEKQRLREYLELQSSAYSDGWFGKVVQKLSDMKPDRIMFDHTDFESSNESPLLQEFILFACLKSHKIFMDVFQSTAPDFTPIFWTFPYVPGSSWGDTTPKFPLSRLAFGRKASYREGDDGRWLWHSSES